MLDFGKTTMIDMTTAMIRTSSLVRKRRQGNYNLM